MSAGREHANAATRLWPAVVFLVVAVLSFAAFGVTRRVVDDQERHLLAERRAEVGAFLATAIGSIEASLGALGAVADSDVGDTAFVPTAEHLRSNEAATVAIADRDGAGYRVRAAVGPTMQAGDVLTGAHADVAARALERGGLVGARVENGTAGLVFAVPSEDGAVLEELPIQPTQPVEAAEDTPYSGLRLALYAGPEADPDDLVLTTEAEVPLRGDVSRLPLEVGADEWLLSISARDRLAGSFAHAAPWLLLAGGLVSGVLAAVVTGTLARRRAYAVGLVAARTADLKQAQEAAERANRSKSEFLSRMSHELRTPLNSVLGFAQLLELDELSDQQRDAVEHIRKGGQHLLELINEVLDISRVETGNLALSPEPVLVADLVSESVDLIEPLAAQRGITVVVDRDGAWARHVLADRQRAKQILLNLLSNAVKYNRNRGSVVVTTSQPTPSTVRIDVSDTGPGVAAEHLDLVFEPFERLGAEHTGVEGAGVGMALSRRLAEAMDGTLTLDSRLGRGSTFSLELPAVEGPLERYDRLDGATAAASPAPDATTATILHIEDNLSNVTLVERIVEQRPGVDVVAAMQGRLGVELARELRPKLVLLDLHLPDMSGEEVLQRLRDDAATASIPVVIVSADATPGQVRRLLSVGAAAYLTKPIEVRELLALVDDAIGRP